MSKELEALERIGQFQNPRDFTLKTDNGENKEWHFETIKELFPNDFELIKSALKEKEKQDILINVIKEVFEFGITYHSEEKDNGDLSVCGLIGYTLTREITNKEKELYRDFILEECFPKELKSLDIIKEKNVDVDLFYTVIEDENQEDKFWAYNFWLNDEYKLTQEEFNLLKEVLLK